MWIQNVLFVLIAALPLVVNASDEHNHADDHEHEHESEHADSTEIEESMALRSGVVVSVAAEGKIERHVQVYGTLQTPPEQFAQVRARFAGLVKTVAVNVGQNVKQGDVLAVIESNDSLQNYELRAPIAGVVQHRAVNPGEITSAEPLFTIIGNETLWANLQIFPAQRFDVAVGQSVHIQHNGHNHEGAIAHLVPGSGESPYVIARVPLQNTHNDMVPGDMLSAQIDAQLMVADVVVTSEAVQTLEGEDVVFVQQGEHYIARPVAVGASDGVHTQILQGLEQGERYVARNSYLIKADIKKSGAAHSH